MSMVSLLLGTGTGWVPPSGKKRTWHRSVESANEARRDQAIARYRGAMGSDWITTSVVESRLGICRGGALDQLKKWEGLGLLESRERIPGSRRGGFEWRWKK